MLSIVIALFAAAWIVPVLRLRSYVQAHEHGDGVEAAARLVRACVYAALATGGLVVALIAANILPEYLWYDQLGAASVYSSSLATEIGLFIGTFVVITLVLHLLTRWVLPIPSALKFLNGFDESDLEPKQLNPWRSSVTAARLMRILVILSIAFMGAFGAKDYWQQAILLTNSSPVGEVDPVFGKDLGFYFFTLPVLRPIVNELMFLCIVALGMCVGACLFFCVTAEERFGKGSGAGLLRHFLPRLILMPIPFLAALIGSFWIGRYELLASTSGRVFGAAFVDLYGSLPMYWITMVVLALAIAGLIIMRIRRRMPEPKIVGYGSAGSVVALIALNFIVPFGVQRLVVNPSEYEHEEEYIKNSIAFTKKGFNIENVEEHDYDPNGDLKLPDLQRSQVTLDNIRLADYKALGFTLNQLQEIAQYYEFPDIDVDRYVIDGKLRQVMLATRELETNLLPEQSQTWNNLHLGYTHGYGVCVASASQFNDDGMPKLHVKDIPPHSDTKELTVARPEIYFGELTRQHVYVNTGFTEFSHPKAAHTPSTKAEAYQGTAGIALGGGLRRFVMAWKFDGFTALISDYLSSESRVIWRRNIHERVQAVAPFLRFDPDAYKVIRSDGSLAYVIDGYTVSDKLPYSEHHDGINYIRNSVKAVVDAYNGTVTLYVVDEKCPILNAWRAKYPEIFKPASSMPEDLRQHMRYPEDLLNLQAKVYAQYHMDPYSFYTREDYWQFAEESNLDGKAPVEAYSALVKLPGEQHEEFLLMLPFTPRNKTNLVGWMAGRCDGEHYGKLFVYRMPRDRLVFGPMQIEAKIDQDEEMSAQLSLWKMKGSEVMRGNLLVIPIEGGLLYHEPIYIKAEHASMPQVARVVVGFGERIAWGRNFNEALHRLFDGSGHLPPVQNIPVGSIPNPSGDSGLQSKAAELLDKYLLLTGEGKFKEAAEALNELRNLLHGTN